MSCPCRRKTGAGSRGPRGAKGARIIRLRLGESAALSATWIRTEDGQRLAGDVAPTLPASKQRQARCSAGGERGWRLVGSAGACMRLLPGVSGKAADLQPAPWLPCALACPADNWFLQRLRYRSFVVALIACGAAAAALVATTAAATVLAMRWRQRAAARRRKRAGAGAGEAAELVRLREAL